MKQHELRHISLTEREEIARVARHIAIHGKTERGPLATFMRAIFKIALVIFALIGFGFLSIYAAVNLHLTNTEGIVDDQANGFWDSGKTVSTFGQNGIQIGADAFFNRENYCKMKALKADYPGTFSRIFDLARHGEKDSALKNLASAMDSLDTISGRSELCAETFDVNITEKDFNSLANIVDRSELFIFATSTEWGFFKKAVVKDKDVIKKVEDETHIKSRVLVAELVAEQMRLFYSDRAWFEKAISPAKVLTSMSQFSWGVLGIKDFTAEEIEANLKNVSSEYYLGPEYEQALDFKTDDPGKERFERITSRSDHYYGYLYAALFNKQIISQWQAKGIDISDRPEILATIYNIGFAHSKPHDDPQMGGAVLVIEGKQYSFGRVAYDFYYSGELLDEFPQ